MQRNQILFLGLAVSAGLTSAAIAGSPEAPLIEPAAPVAPVEAAPVTLNGDWTGFYAGLQLGYLDADATGGLEADDTTYGIHLGYDYDFGQFVLGGELDYDATSAEFAPGVEIDSVTRAKLRFGYDAGVFRQGHLEAYALTRARMVESQPNRVQGLAPV